MTDIDLAHAAYNAGFRNDGLRTFVAIEMAENASVPEDGDSSKSYLNTFGKEIPPGFSAEISCGPAQINLVAHPDINPLDAMSYDGAAYWGYRISSSGSNFAPWSTYQEGQYRDYLTRADAAIKQAIPEISESIRIRNVMPGDTLWSIAQDVYGDGSKWGIIYEANIEMIGNNPGAIVPGMQLVIPPEVAQ